MRVSKPYTPNELEMTLRIAMRAIDQQMDQKPKGGLVVNKGTDHEARMSFQEAKLCLERLERMFGLQGAFSLGICGSCLNWTTAGHGTAHWEDCGTCRLNNKSVHRYHSCDSHSKTNGGWGL